MIRADQHLAMEQVARIDKEVNKLFPETNKFFNAASDTEKKTFLKTLDEALFSGKVDETIDKNIVDSIVDTMRKRGSTPEAVDTILTGIEKIRNQYGELINIASKGSGELPTELTLQLKGLMGDRLKTMVGTTYEIFDNKIANVFNKFTIFFNDNAIDVKNVRSLIILIFCNLII